MRFTLSDCRIWLYNIMGYTIVQIPFFGEVPETGLPFLCTCGRWYIPDKCSGRPRPTSEQVCFSVGRHSLKCDMVPHYGKISIIVTALSNGGSSLATCADKLPAVIIIDSNRRNPYFINTIHFAILHPTSSSLHTYGYTSSLLPNSQIQSVWAITDGRYSKNRKVSWHWHDTVFSDWKAIVPYPCRERACTALNRWTNYMPWARQTVCWTKDIF